MRFIHHSNRYIMSLCGLLLLAMLIFSGCGSTAHENPDKSSLPLRPSVPVVLIPTADGTKTFENAKVRIDYSNCSEGYIIAYYIGSSQKARLQISGPDRITYTYIMHGGQEVFPLPSGSGQYEISVYENIQDDQYAAILMESLEVSLKDDHSAFLYPSQYVWFDESTEAVKKGEELATGCHDDLEVVEKVYTFVKDNITYDEEKAKTVKAGYLPVVDDVLSSGTGICFDYAALMATMLRTQQIPTRLNVGYTGSGVYHAWLSVYITDTGWVDGYIQFDGKDWVLMDPTFAASFGSERLQKYIGDNSNYILKYTY